LRLNYIAILYSIQSYTSIIQAYTLHNPILYTILYSIQSYTLYNRILYTLHNPVLYIQPYTLLYNYTILYSIHLYIYTSIHGQAYTLYNNPTVLNNDPNQIHPPMSRSHHHNPTIQISKSNQNRRGYSGRGELTANIQLCLKA